MKLTTLKKGTTTLALGLAMLFGASEVNAQYNDRYNNNRIRKQERKIQKQQQKLERQQQRYNQMRYRVYNNGRYYNYDDQGVQVLRQAVNNGYQQGYQAGQYDRSNRYRYGSSARNYRYNSYNNGYVEQNQYQYYFQQGFERGYQDGYSTRRQYGNNSGGILSSILSTILNIQQY